MPIIQPRVVFEYHAVVLLMAVEAGAQGCQHFIVAGLAGFGCVRRREQPPAQALKIEILRVIEARNPVRATEEGRDRLRIFFNVDVVDLVVIGSVGLQQGFVFTQKWAGGHVALIPDQRHPTARSQDAAEFGAGSPVSSALPARLVKLESFASRRSPAARISAFGSTPVTAQPRSRNRRASSPVPEPISATSEAAERPHSARRVSITPEG